MHTIADNNIRGKKAVVNNKLRIGPAERTFDVFNIIFMILMCLITLYPFLHVIFASFSSPSKLMAHSGVLLWPKGFSMAAYNIVFRNSRVWSGYGNTIFYVVVGTSFNILMTVLAAYGLSRKGLMFSRVITLMIIFTMYFSGGLIPSFLLVKGIGLYDSRFALIIPGAISTYNMIIMRTAMHAIPDSLEESARLDGATQLQVLFKVILPLVTPTIAVLVLYYGVGHWNSWFNAAIYLKSPEKFPLQLYLRQLLIQNALGDMMQSSGTEDQEMIAATIKYATIIIATLPVLLLYPFLQRFFVKGVMVGSLKE